MSLVLPDTNASLTLVQRRSGGDAYEGPAGPGAEVWAGAARVYVESTSGLKASKGDVVQSEPAYVVLDQADGVLVELDALVTLELDTGETVDRRVQTIDRFDVPSMTQLVFWEV